MQWSFCGLWRSNRWPECDGLNRGFLSWHTHLSDGNSYTTQGKPSWLGAESSSFKNFHSRLLALNSAPCGLCTWSDCSTEPKASQWYSCDAVCGFAEGPSPAATTMLFKHSGSLIWACAEMNKSFYAFSTGFHILNLASWALVQSGSWLSLVFQLMLFSLWPFSLWL